MKRFYKVVSTDKCDGGYSVCLDGRPVKTQSKQMLCAPNEGIASAIMEEWAQQEDVIIPDTMPFTQILSTKIDRVSVERDAIFSNMLKYLDTDLLCYQVSEPEELRQRQEDQWRPWLKWFQTIFGEELLTTTSLNALQQPEKAYDAVKQYIKNLDDDHFTILQVVTNVSGSLVLALAFLHKAITPQKMFDACYIEELFKDTLYNAEKYGQDPILEKQQKAAMLDFETSAHYLKLL